MSTNHSNDYSPTAAEGSGEARRSAHARSRPTGDGADAPESGTNPEAESRPSRRQFLTATAAGLAGVAVAPPQLAGLRSATAADTQDLVGIDGKRRILLKGASCSASTREWATSRRPTS